MHVILLKVYHEQSWLLPLLVRLCKVKQSRYRSGVAQRIPGS